MDNDREETLAAFIERRVRELTNKIAAIRADLEVKETELAHLEAVKRMVGRSKS